MGAPVRKIRPSQLKKICVNFEQKNLLAPKIVRTERGGNGNGILRVPRLKDHEGKSYIPFCNYRSHMGIILDNPESCIQKKCRYYQTLQIEKPNMSLLANYYFQNLSN